MLEQIKHFLHPFHFMHHLPCRTYFSVSTNHLIDEGYFIKLKSIFIMRLTFQKQTNAWTNFVSKRICQLVFHFLPSFLVELIKENMYCTFFILIWWVMLLQDVTHNVCIVFFVHGFCSFYCRREISWSIRSLLKLLLRRKEVSIDHMGSTERA